MNNITGIKAIVFDLDGTLYDLTNISEKFMRHVCKKVSINKRSKRRKIKDLFAKIRSESDVEMNNIFSLAVIVCKKMGLTSKEIDALFDSFQVERYLKCDKKTIDALNDLKAQCKLILVTQASERRTIRFLEALGIRRSTFDLIMTGEAFKFKKLNPAILKRVAATMHFLPQEVLVVGDTVKLDLEPAKRLGMKTVLVRAEQSLLTHLIDFRVHDISDVLKIIGKNEHELGYADKT